MSKAVSKTQVDRLGDRLRKGNITEDDLRLLDQYRRSFREAYDTAIGRIRNELSLEPTGRPAKSTTSISDKLRRESIRLVRNEASTMRLEILEKFHELIKQAEDLKGEDDVVTN